MNFIYKLFDWRKCKRKFNPASFCGAGNVNHWHNTARKETAKLAKAGIPVYHIEVFGWADTATFDDLKGTLKQLKDALFWCKRRNMVLFVSVVNDNAHLAKYGNTPINLGHFQDNIAHILYHLAKAVKQQKVYIQPVGETQTSAGRQIEELAKTIIPREYLVANTNSRPRGVPGWASYAAYHAARTADPVPRSMWDVTDHGLILAEMGGVYAQAYNNDIIFADARRARDSGNPYVLYGFQVKKLDKGNLKAIANGYYGK